MTNLRNMDDLIIIIPGVMGSVLQRSNGQEAWGCKGGVFNNLVTLGKIAKCLALRADIGDSEPQDGVTASGLMPGLHLLPGFWGIDGYNEMIGSLRKSFNLHEVTSATPGNLLLFPYDWRLSNRVSAQKLKETAERELDRWREHKKNKNAKLILICHSMGGLVARWFLEVLGGRMITKHLVTLGTPYQGSIDALSTLANGLTIDFGPIGVNLTELVRSLPSVYQLLPTYHCVDPGDKQLRLLTELKNVPNLDARRVENAAAFHYTIAEEIKKRSATGETAPYQITAIQGIKQPTAQSALLRTIGFPNPIQPIFSLNGDDWGGDGTVPRPSSRPPEFGNHPPFYCTSQKHASLQTTDFVLAQIFGSLTGTQVGPFMAGNIDIALTVPPLVKIGEDLIVRVSPPVGSNQPQKYAALALQAVITPEDGTHTRVPPEPLRNEGGGRYQAKFSRLAAGAYRIRIESLVLPQQPIEPVTDFTVVWDDEISLAKTEVSESI